MSKVLVTGGTGFIAGHCIRQLLEKGYTVVTTVRSDEKGESILKAHTAITGADSKLSYQIVADIAKAGAFDEVVKSTSNLRFVLHTASPFHYNVQDPVKDFLEPAVTGSTSILRAIHQFAPSVKRVILTSSLAAMRDDTVAKPHYDESCWNPITWEEAVENKKKTYQGSKSLAERAAWDFIAKEKPQFDLVSILPTLVFGPAAPHLINGELSSLNTSNIRILDMMQGKMKEKLDPTGFYTWVDVRDVALAHVNALEVPGVSGKRFFVISGYHTNKQIAHIIANMSPSLKIKLPADFESAEDDIPGPDERYTFDNEQSRKVLGINYKPINETIQDTVTSLLELGA